MVTALPWYDFPAVADRWDTLWQGLRRHLADHGLEAAPSLTRGICPYSLLREPNLMLSQVCGYVAGGVGEHLIQILATPDYALGPERLGDAAAPCPPGDYYSLVVVPRDSNVQQLADLRGARFAANEALSHSGLNGLRPLVQALQNTAPGEHRFFGSVIFTGGHLASLAHLAEGLADVACVDAVTFALARSFAPDLVDAVRVITTTAPAPAPPLVTGLRTSARDVAAWTTALGTWCAVGDDAARRELGWRGITTPSIQRYRHMAGGGRRAAAQGDMDFVFDEQLPDRGPWPEGGC